MKKISLIVQVTDHRPMSTIQTTRDSKFIPMPQPK
jgi:hypothetical protein